MKHLFLRILCHELGDPDEGFAASAAEGSTLTDLPRSDSPTPFTEDDDEMEMREFGNGSFYEDEKTLKGSTTLRGTKSTWRKNRPLLPTSRADIGSKHRRSTNTQPRSRLSELATMRDDAAEKDKKRRADEIAIRALKSGDRVNVKVSPMFIFLFRDGAQYLFFVNYSQRS